MYGVGTGFRMGAQKVIEYSATQHYSAIIHARKQFCVETPSLQAIMP